MTSTTMKATILGGGRMAQVLSGMLLRTGVQVQLWARREEVRNKLAAALKDVKVCATVGEACEGSRTVFLTVPANALAEVSALYGDHAEGDHVVLHAARGVAEGFVLPHQAIRSQCCVRKVGALGGPLYTIADGSSRPLVAVVGSRFTETVELARRLVSGTSVRIHITSDIVGVEVAGAVSNVTALAVGMADALDLGETARGVLMTRGLSEATRLGVRLGAELSTFSGLAGVGDLIPRPVSSMQRHRDVGARVAQGATLEQALASVQGCVEGVLTAFEGAALSRRLGVKLPLVCAVDQILRGETQPRAALDEILRLDIELERESVSAR
ncbi:MAG: NAD(P)-binding domain-containing protein [Myxococcota bacterium]